MEYVFPIISNWVWFSHDGKRYPIIRQTHSGTGTLDTDGHRPLLVLDFDAIDHLIIKYQQKPRVPGNNLNGILYNPCPHCWLHTVFLHGSYCRFSALCSAGFYHRLIAIHIWQMPIAKHLWYWYVLRFGWLNTLNTCYCWLNTLLQPIAGQTFLFYEKTPWYPLAICSMACWKIHHCSLWFSKQSSMEFGDFRAIFDNGGCRNLVHPPSYYLPLSLCIYPLVMTNIAMV